MIILADVENGCQSFLKDVRSYSNDILVLLVVPKSYSSTQIKATLPLCTPPTYPALGYPKSDWVWIIRASSDEKQAVDVKLQQVGMWLLGQIHASLEAECPLTLSEGADDDIDFESLFS